jgi:pseudouridine synthase
VHVNGKVVTELGTKVCWGVDLIVVDGRKIPAPSPRVYLMLNKPFGYVCSLRDPEGRPIANHLLQDIPQRVYPVGRLDFDSLGLLLFTNDGQWAYRLTHPRFKVAKTYKVTVQGKVTESAIGYLTKGVLIEEKKSVSCKVVPVNLYGDRSVLRMTITQGKARQIRRMMEAVGHPVIQLMRIGFGNLTLGNLKVGQYRYLEASEVISLTRVVKD